MSRVRTRFATVQPRKMHVGNLRTALYAYLIAKHEDGDFILRIEDTDQERFVEGALEIIAAPQAEQVWFTMKDRTRMAVWVRTSRVSVINQVCTSNMPSS